MKLRYYTTRYGTSNHLHTVLQYSNNDGVDWWDVETVIDTLN